MKYVVGVDSGFQGAIAIITGRTGGLVSVNDMPVFNTGKGSRQAYSVDVLRDIISGFTSEYIVYLEDVQSFPPGFRIQVSYNLGVCRGLFIGMLEMGGVRYQFVRAREWQRQFGITKDKGNLKAQSFIIAHQLFPLAKLTTPRGRKLDGRSDALLIAEYGRRMLNLFDTRRVETEGNSNV